MANDVVGAFYHRFNAGVTPPTKQFLENCNAVFIGFAKRRFIVVRRDPPSHLRLVEPRHKRIRDLKRGNRVIYKGEPQVVRWLEVCG